MNSQHGKKRASALRFLENAAWRENYQISKGEVESVSTVAMFGELKSEHDLLFIIHQLRRAKLRGCVVIAGLRTSPSRQPLFRAARGRPSSRPPLPALR